MNGIERIRIEHARIIVKGRIAQDQLAVVTSLFENDIRMRRSR